MKLNICKIFKKNNLISEITKDIQLNEMNYIAIEKELKRSKRFISQGASIDFDLYYIQQDTLQELAIRNDLLEGRILKLKNI